MTDKNENPVVVHWEFVSKLNFACHQNSFPVLRELLIENRSTEDSLSNLRISIGSDPEFLKPRTWIIDKIQPGGTASIKERLIELNGSFLHRLTEALRGSITLTVECKDCILAESTKPVDVLACNEWGGASFMPELLAAFSIPNDPAIDRILHSASQLLRNAGRPDRLQGYDFGGRVRVWEVASVIYRAIANLGITYAVPPASFEQNGQKIRLPSQIIEGKVATCLDTAMLFAASFEQAGLNPIIALPHAHAVAGVWLQPNEQLASIVVDDAETLRKAHKLEELILIETTFVTSSKPPLMKYAIDRAMKHLVFDNEDTFIAAIDIKRARDHAIMPLGLELHPREEIDQDHPISIEDDRRPLETSPVLSDFDSEPESGRSETPAGRLERWQRKLLDLTARNPLLNHRSKKTSLEFICPDPGELENRIAADETISIKAVPQPTSNDQDEEVHVSQTGRTISEKYARRTLETGQILVNLPAQDFEKRIVEIARRAQASLQETGSNTLYLAIGFLRWSRARKDKRSFRAPLVLVPVTLKRSSVRSGFKMLSHDDETRVNTTLLEMLRRDFKIDIGKLDDQLPEDNSGVDVHGIWSQVQRAVKDVPGLEVEEDAMLGHFSFSKYLMWKDLKDRIDALRENRLVRLLIDGPSEKTSEIAGDSVWPKDLDRKLVPSDLLAPLPADASQMAAIATSSRGKDLIIIGPPGTGKSQTISNMIVHLLGVGKTVLFVSEKAVALDVVHRRLADVGLGSFCLELHSNKARKSKVMAQLRDAWTAGAQKTKGEWRREGERLRVLRDQLNHVVDYLHKPRRNGLTPHHAMGIRVRDAAFAKRVNFSWPSADHHDESQLDRMREIVNRLRISTQAVPISDNPLRAVGTTNWTPQWQDELIRRATTLAAAAEVLDTDTTALADMIGMRVSDRTLPRIKDLAALAAALRDSHGRQVAFSLEPHGNRRINALRKLAGCLRRYAAAHADLSVEYKPEAWRNVDGAEIVRRWDLANATWWPKTWFQRFFISWDLLKHGAKKWRPRPEQDGPALEQLRKEGEEIDQLACVLFEFPLWEGFDTDPEEAVSLSRVARRIRKAALSLENVPGISDNVWTLIHDVLRHEDTQLGPDAPVGQAADRHVAALAALKAAVSAFDECAGLSTFSELMANGSTLETLRITANAIIERQGELQKWCLWRRRRSEALEVDLGPLVETIESGYVRSKDIAKTFEAAYCTWWSSRIFGEDEVLRHWSTEEHVDAIAEFRAVDDSFSKLTAAYVSTTIGERLPDHDEVERQPQWVRMRKLVGQTKPRIPIRKMMKDMADPITCLTPCLMMSPLSVAQYLSPEHAIFDVVIIDEASQLTVWDAVGAIARGRQTIVAGDPKQLPPTNFFMRADSDSDDDIDYEDDLESILDELRGASVPERTLNLHYRSRRESLIAFSNAHYYGNSLITFPAPVHPDRGVRLERPNGFYARGTARHNQGEAKAVVDEVVRRLASDESSVREKTIGVVTFNSEQQTLILDLLDKKRSENPEIEWAFAENAREPVFVKNLETVQGDERDVILFSVTYGPDRTGHVTMNFGPLNREGGERRLNVAMTRARHEMVVFSTLRPDQINVSRTKAQAVTDLKHFLDYAEKGPRALGREVRGSVGDFESPFETAVAEALRSHRPWELHPQVGVSAYRIDIGIVHPDKPGVYLAGVECDGEMYHRSVYAKERDKIRQSVLEGLGWTLFRVWSADWWLDQRRALDTLLARLDAHLAADREKHQRAKTPTRKDQFGSAGGETPRNHTSQSKASPAPVKRKRPGSRTEIDPTTGGTQLKLGLLGSDGVSSKD